MRRRKGVPSRFLRAFLKFQSEQNEIFKTKLHRRGCCDRAESKCASSRLISIIIFDLSSHHSQLVQDTPSEIDRIILDEIGIDLRIIRVISSRRIPAVFHEHGTLIGEASVREIAQGFRFDSIAAKPFKCGFLFRKLSRFLAVADYVVFRPMVNYDRGKFYHMVQPLLDYLKDNMPEYYEAYHDYMYKGAQLPAALFDRANEMIDGDVAKRLAGTGIEAINIRTKMMAITHSGNG